MELKKFKEKNPKKVGIILFTISCILLITGVILYRTFAIFEVNETQNMIEGNIQDEGDIRFMVYIDDVLQKDVPSKESGYSLDTSTSYCENGSIVSWNDERWSVEIKNISTTKTKCYLKFKQIYKEGILNDAIPDLGNELIPITFDETGHAKKADITKEWYKYTEQKWANGIILKKKQEYQMEEIIPEENIESYFVWIPRYEYQIWNGEEQTNGYTEAKDLGSISDIITKEELYKQIMINIKFTNKTEATKTGSTNGSWLTHPAFTSFNSNGFWVGKFETGYNQNEDVTNLNTNNWTAENAKQNIILSDRLIIKPNVYSWRGIQVANAFYTIYNYKRELDSHMMRNLEWGAVAYLTHSIYGRCPKEVCSEVRINNSSNYVTGSSAVNEPTCATIYTSQECNKYGKNELGKDLDGIVVNYNNNLSTKSSTTANYYGVFDMSGGTLEHVMGVVQDQNGNPVSGRDDTIHSNFIGTFTYSLNGKEPLKKEWTKEDGGLLWPSKKYYDIYEDFRNNSAAYQRGILGDGTKEFGPFYKVTYNETNFQSGSWYADQAGFAYSYNPWISRGGNYLSGTEAGLMAFGFSGGSEQNDASFRVILTP